MERVEWKNVGYEMTEQQYDQFGEEAGRKSCIVRSGCGYGYVLYCTRWSVPLFCVVNMGVERLKMVGEKMRRAETFPIFLLHNWSQV